jgi:hypothetical protein
MEMNTLLSVYTILDTLTFVFESNLGLKVYFFQLIQSKMNLLILKIQYENPN